MQACLCDAAAARRTFSSDAWSYNTVGVIRVRLLLWRRDRLLRLLGLASAAAAGVATKVAAVAVVAAAQTNDNIYNNS